MDAARALADLVEISPQIEAAVLFGADGEMLGAIGVEARSARDVTGAARRLLDGGAALRTEGARVTQLHASLGEGDVFVVDGGERGIVSVTSRPQAPGLVFYDLKRCLAAVAGDEPEAKKKRSRRRKRRKEKGDEA